MKYVKLGNIAKFRYGKMPDKDKFLDDGYPVFSGYRITGYYSEYMVENPTLIVVARGVGGTGDVKISPPKSYITNLSIIVDFDESVADMRYLYYQFVCNNLRYLDTGAAQSQITINNLSKHKALLPRLVIQKKISSILTTYDNLIENNNKRIRILEQMAENLYKEWFVRFRFPGYENVEFENGIPKGWKIESLSDIADIIMGQSPESENYNTNCIGLPFHQGVGSYGDFYLIDGVYSTKGNRIAEANSIIFSVRAPVGRINITLNKIILGRGVAGINSVKGYNAYLLWMLKNRFQQEDIIGNGSIFASVTKKELFGFKMFMPNEDLIQKFDSIASGIESVMRNISLINSNLKKQRDMLLPRLMSGKLEV